MFVRLFRVTRSTAGWLMALAYLFCALAPTISLASPGGHAIAYCLTGNDHMPGMVHAHNEDAVQHVHTDRQVHDPSDVQSHAHAAGDHQAKSVALNDDSVPVKAPHSSSGQCCSLMCVTLLPETFVDVAKPLVPNAVRDAEGYRKLTDNAHARLYRPPIS